MATINKLCCQLLAGCRLIFMLPAEISAFHFTRKLSILVERNSRSTRDHLQSSFAEFAMNKFNMSPVDIAGIFRRVPRMERLETLEKVEKVVEMFDKHGCDHHQIAKIMKCQPSLFLSNPERVLEPKIQVLKEWGIQGEYVAQVLTKRPSILSCSLQDDLVPKMTILKNIFYSHEFSLTKAIVRTPSILTYNVQKTLKPSVAFWEEYGFRGEELGKFLIGSPTLLRQSSLQPAKADLIQKIGIDKGSKMYKHVLRVVVPSRMGTLEAKMHNLQQWGLSTEETLKLFSVYPFAFGLSKENVRERMEFFVNNLELPPNTVVKHPKMLQKCLEKVVKPRLLVLQEIKYTHGVQHLNTNSLSLSRILAMKEGLFVSKIVKGYPESAKLHSIYENAICSASSRRRTSKIPSF